MDKKPLAARISKSTPCLFLPTGRPEASQPACWASCTQAIHCNQKQNHWFHLIARLLNLLLPDCQGQSSGIKAVVAAVAAWHGMTSHRVTLHYRHTSHTSHHNTKHHTTLHTHIAPMQALHTQIRTWHTYMHASIQAYIHTFIACMHTYIHACIHTCTHTLHTCNHASQARIPYITSHHITSYHITPHQIASRYNTVLNWHAGIHARMNALHAYIYACIRT